MRKINIRITCGFFVFGAFLWLLPCVRAQVDCDKDPSGALQRAIDAASSVDTIAVTGTCNENVRIVEGKDLITLDGGGKATIHGPDATDATVLVKGRGIAVKGFTITGGLWGIRVAQGGTALIDGNTVESTSLQGISVDTHSYGVIVNNMVQKIPEHGIFVGGTSFAFIGFRDFRDTAASTNIIQETGGAGIIVVRSSGARIVGNMISNNTLDGINVGRGSQADISDNRINGNGQNGIHVVGGSGVNLGGRTGDTIFTRPNSTKTNNGDFGIRCEIGGYVDGRLGSLDGDSGDQSFSEGCINSLIGKN